MPSAPGTSHALVSRRVRAALVLGLGLAVGRGTLALYLVLLIRELPASDYGDLAYALAVLNIVLTVADGGFARLLTRDVARLRRPERLVRDLTIVRTAWTATMLAVCALAYATDRWHPEALEGSFAIVLLAVALAESLGGGLESAAIGAERPWRVAIGQFLYAATLAAWVGVLIGVGVSRTAAIAGLAAASTVKLAWQLGAWRAALAIRARLPSRSTARQWAAEALPFLVLALLGAIYYRIDVVILHAVRGSTETASYAAAYRVVDAAVILGGVFSAALTPHLSRLHRKDPASVWMARRRYVRWTLVVSAPFVTLVTLTAHPIAEVLFGEDYRGSAGSDLRLLAPGVLFMLLQLVNVAVLFSSDVQRLLVRMSLLHVLFNVVLTWLLVQDLGSEGAALATSISEGITFAYFTGFAWWLFRRPYRERA